jgi:large subunit ribosomal protein L18
MNRAQARVEARDRIHERIRRKVEGTPERPRLAIRRTLKYIYAQLIDDASGRTLAQASSREGSILAGKKSAAGRSSAVSVGALIAERAKEKGIAAVVFDRGGHLYHGNVKALADSAREKGLKF